MRVLPPMTLHQQRLYCALALLEESDLKAFFRQIRDEADAFPEVELVNIEMDRGIALMDIFGPLGPLAGHMDENWLELDVLRLEDGRWAISFGFHGHSGHGRTWSMSFSPEGMVVGLMAGVEWGPGR